MNQHVGRDIHMASTAPDLVTKSVAPDGKGLKWIFGRKRSTSGTASSGTTTEELRSTA